MAVVELIGPMPRYSYRNKQFLRGQSQSKVAKDVADYLRTTGFFRVKEDAAVTIIHPKDSAPSAPAVPGQFSNKKSAMVWARREYDTTIAKGWSLKKMNKATARLASGLELTAGWDTAVSVGGDDVADAPVVEEAGEEV